jgi:hypothetical protein
MRPRRLLKLSRINMLCSHQRRMITATSHDIFAPSSLKSLLYQFKMRFSITLSTLHSPRSYGCCFPDCRASRHTRTRRCTCAPHGSATRKASGQVRRKDQGRAPHSLRSWGCSHRCVYGHRLAEHQAHEERPKSDLLRVWQHQPWFWRRNVSFANFSTLLKQWNAVV